MKTFGFLILVFVELLYISPGFSESLHDPVPTSDPVAAEASAWDVPVDLPAVAPEFSSEDPSSPIIFLAPPAPRSESARDRFQLFGVDSEGRRLPTIREQAAEFLAPPAPRSESARDRFQLFGVDSEGRRLPTIGEQAAELAAVERQSQRLAARLVSIRKQHIINEILRRSAEGPLPPGTVQDYRRQIAQLPFEAAAELPQIRAIVALSKRDLERSLGPSSTRTDEHLREGPEWAPSLVQSQDPLSRVLEEWKNRDMAAGDKYTPEDYLDVASTQATGPLLESRGLAEEVESFSKKVAAANYRVAEDFRTKLEESATVDTGEVDGAGRRHMVLPGQIANELRGEFQKLAGERYQKSLNTPQFQQKVRHAIEGAISRYGEETVSKVLEAARSGSDINQFLPQGPENMSARIELHHLARTVAAIKQVDDSLLALLPLGAQIIDEEQFKTIRNQNGFEDRHTIAKNVFSLLEKALADLDEKLGCMEGEGIVTRFFSIFPDAIAASPVFMLLPTRCSPASYPKLLRLSLEDVLPQMIKLGDLTRDLIKTQNPEEFGRVYDQILNEKQKLAQALKRLARNAKEYKENSVLARNIALTATAITAGSLTGGTATGIIATAVASGLVRGGVESLDEATSEKGYQKGTFSRGFAQGAFDSVTGAGIGRAQKALDVVLSQSLKNASPAVQGLASWASSTLLIDGSAGTVSGAFSAALEGKPVLEGAGQGLLWGTVLGGLFRTPGLVSGLRGGATGSPGAAPTTSEPIIVGGGVGEAPGAGVTTSSTRGAGLVPEVVPGTGVDLHGGGFPEGTPGTGTVDVTASATRAGTGVDFHGGGASTLTTQTSIGGNSVVPALPVVRPTPGVHSPAQGPITVGIEGGVGLTTQADVLASSRLPSGGTYSFPITADAPATAGTGTIEVTGPFDSAYQRIRTELDGALQAGNIRRPGKQEGMLSLYYPPNPEAQPTFGRSLNLRPGREIHPGNIEPYSPEALAQIAEGRATTCVATGCNWNRPGGCSECEAIRLAGGPSPEGITTSFYLRQIDQVVNGQSYRYLALDYAPTPQCRSCQTIGVRDLLTETTTNLQVFDPNSPTFFSDVTPQWMRTYWSSP